MGRLRGDRRGGDAEFGAGVIISRPLAGRYWKLPAATMAMEKREWRSSNGRLRGPEVQRTPETSRRLERGRGRFMPGASGGSIR